MADTGLCLSSWACITLAAIGLGWLQAAQVTGAPDREPVRSPISGKSLVELVHEAVTLGATQEDLYSVTRGRHAPELRALIDKLITQREGRSICQIQ